METIHQDKHDQNKTGVAILIPDRVDFREKNLRDKEDRFVTGHNNSHCFCTK